MARFNITLPDALRAQLETEARQGSTKISTLIAQCVKEHYAGAPTAEYEAQLQKCKDENAILWHKVELFQDDTAENVAAHDMVVQELQNELDAAKTRTKGLEQDVVNKDDKIQLLEQDLTAALGTVEALDQGAQELIKQAEQERASKETAKTGLQHELERTQDNVKGLEEYIVELKGQIKDLKEDKQSLQKQLELVTLRLPAPKEGFWARTFGRRKKEQET